MAAHLSTRAGLAYGRTSPADGGGDGSTLICRNVTVSGRRTSVRLEQPMWDALEEMCRREGRPLNRLVSDIEDRRQESSLTAAIRVHVLLYFWAAATEDGHRRAGHGPLLPKGISLR